MDVYCKVVVPRDTGLPEDDMVMDWAFFCDPLGASTLEDLATWLEAFYSSVASGDVGYGARTKSVAGWTCSSVLGDNATAKFWQIDHGPPVNLTFLEQHAFSWDAENGNPLPEECAVRLTAHGVLDGGEADRRRRGGWFLGGGIQKDAAAFPVAGRVLVHDDMLTDMRSAARNGHDTQVADTAWSIWSRAEAGLIPVVGGWVDNAFDTIRSRGPGPSVRESWTGTP